MPTTKLSQAELVAREEEGRDPNPRRHPQSCPQLQAQGGAEADADAEAEEMAEAAGRGPSRTRNTAMRSFLAAPPSRRASPDRRRRRPSRCGALLAAAAVASLAAVDAFGGSQGGRPLPHQGGSLGRARAGPATGKAGEGGGAAKRGSVRDHPQRPPGIMAVTDPETLLGEELVQELALRARGAGGAGRPSSPSPAPRSTVVPILSRDQLAEVTLDLPDPASASWVKQIIESDVEVVEPSPSPASVSVPALAPRRDAAAAPRRAKDGPGSPVGKKDAPSTRVSTMPGFAARTSTGRRRRHKDGVRIAERASGRSLRAKLDQPKARKARIKQNSEAMYSSSASVPDSLVAYTDEIHRATQRITPAEEIELGTKTQEAIRLQALYEKLELELSRAPTDEEYCAAAGRINMEALRKAIDDGMEAKNRLVETNLRMVQGVVNLYIRNGLGSQYNAGDLMQDGTMALIRAAEKFEPERGLRFSTYAMYWIRASVKRSQILQSRIVQVPQRLHETHKRVLKQEKTLKGELGRDPTKEELALASGLSVLQLNRCLKAMAQKCFSLDATIQNKFKPGSGGDRKDTMHEIINEKAQDEGYVKNQRSMLKDSLIQSLQQVLTAHEVDLLRLRFGLMDDRTLPYGFAGPLTIAEVSRLVGLKPDKVRRMLNKSLAKLRPVFASEWKDFETYLL